ncbi:MAG: uroporphyrinogen decarboxylase [Candidatus Eisenbacteria bacterium]|nr:uroporphyrinogen decarboxylase [Candidatus Eisenbacteria bacterium]
MNDLFLRACRGEPVERTPVWIMRQAGRYMAEYRAVREKHDFLAMCRTPELAAEVTLQPVNRLGVDAAILFSDILIDLPAMGCPVDFRPGPVLDRPLRGCSDIEALRLPDPEKDLGFVLEAIRILRRELSNRVPLIGFAGAPLTMAAYLVEGGGSKAYAYLKALLYGDPDAARALLNHIARAQELFLAAQIDAGAQAVQLFDSWGGILSRAMYAEFALEPVRRILAGLREKGAPLVYYLRDGAHVLDLLGDCGADVISVDEKLPLSEVARRIGAHVALQGNLDNGLLLGAQEPLENGVRKVLDDAPRDRGLVFNLGHGILPQTPVENAEFLVKTVQESSRGGS